MRSRPPQNMKLFSRCSRAVSVKKGTTKRDTRAKLLFGQSKPIAFLPLSLTSPSSLLKLPTRDFKIQQRDRNENVKKQ